MKGKRRSTLIFMGTLAMAFLSGCSADNNATKNTNSVVDGTDDAKVQVVNLYTDRHYDSDEDLYATFTEETGIEVNVVKGKSDELIERLRTEGEDTEADVFITADAGRLHRAKAADLLQPINSEILLNNIPQNLRDQENFWFGVTKRARVIVYAKDRVDATELSTYKDLADPKWNDRILIRSSENIYNQTLLASFIELNGEEEAKTWATAIVDNMARDPEGGDRDQVKAVVAGEGDIAVINTYYLGQMLNSSDEEERKVAEQISVFFPDQDGDGTHINVSGAGVVKSAKNKDNAIKLLEFLASEKAQKAYAETNYEYPVLAGVEVSDTLKSWGTFKEQSVNLSMLGELNETAIKIFNEIGWK